MAHLIHNENIVLFTDGSQQDRNHPQSTLLRYIWTVHSGEGVQGATLWPVENAAPFRRLLGSPGVMRR